MKINKEPDKMTELHKKRDGTIRKNGDKIISGKKVATRAKGAAESVALTGERVVADYVEGGEEIDRTVYISKTAAKPIKKTASVTKDAGSRIRKQIKSKDVAKKQSEKRIRKAAKNQARNTAKRAGKKVAKKAAKETSKEVSKQVTVLMEHHT